MSGAGRRTIAGVTKGITAVAIVLAAAVSAAVEGAGPGDWPMFRGGPRLAGRAAIETTLDAPVRVWSFRTEAPIEGSAAIVGDTVYLGVTDGTLYALRLADGSVLWKIQVEGGFTTTPLVLGGALFIGDDLGMFHARKASDGSPLWKYDTQSEIHSSANFARLPAVEKEAGAAGASPRARIVFGAYDGNLHCLDPRTGKVIWRFTTEGQVHSTPAVAGGKAFISGCDERFRVIDILTGKEDRSVEMGGYTAASPAVEGDGVYVGTYSCQFLAVDWQRGKILWRFENPDRSLPFHASAAVAAGRVIVAGRDKAVHCLDARSGEVRWHFRSRARFDASPVIAGGRIFVGSGDGSLYLLDLATGRRVWSFTAGPPIVAEASIGRGRLVVGDDDGVVHCFRVVPSAVGGRDGRGAGGAPEKKDERGASER